MKQFFILLFMVAAFISCSDESELRPDCAEARYDLKLSGNTMNTFDVYYTYLSYDGTEEVLPSSSRHSLGVHCTSFPCTFLGEMRIAPKADATGNELSYSITMKVQSLKVRKGTEIDGGYDVLKQDGYNEVFEAKDIRDLQAFADSFNLASVKHTYVVSADGNIKQLKAN